MKPRGRPAKAPMERKRRNLTMRVRDALRDSLGAAAAASGRSLSEEAEFRLEQSFMADDIVERTAVHLVRVVQQDEQMKRAVNKLLEAAE